jgi:Fe-S-cluster-containing dehydrogenase component
LIPYPSSVCDLCRDRLESNGKPLCVNSCGDGSIDYRQVQANENDIVDVFDGIAVKVAGGSLWEPFLDEKQEKV